MKKKTKWRFSFLHLIVGHAKKSRVLLNIHTFLLTGFSFQNLYLCSFSHFNILYLSSFYLFFSKYVYLKLYVFIFYFHSYFGSFSLILNCIFLPMNFNLYFFLLEFFCIHASSLLLIFVLSCTCAASAIMSHFMGYFFY